MDSTDAPHKPLVLVLNTSPDFMAMVAEILDMEGFRSVSAYILEFRKGGHDIRAFLDQHRPAVVIYDIAIPYQENWEFFQHVRTVSGLRDCQYVVVTTNKKALESLVGETGSLEIIGKPMDLDALIAAVTKSVDHCR